MCRTARPFFGPHEAVEATSKEREVRPLTGLNQFGWSSPLNRGRGGWNEGMAIPHLTSFDHGAHGTTEAWRGVQNRKTNVSSDVPKWSGI